MLGFAPKVGHGIRRGTLHPRREGVGLKPLQASGKDLPPPPPRKPVTLAHLRLASMPLKGSLLFLRTQRHPFPVRIDEAHEKNIFG